MANPSVNDGHVRIANELWLAWTRTGPLKERILKAIFYECWGWEERRLAKKPVPITRGTFSKLTGIKDKATISKLTNELSEEHIVFKYSAGGLDTASYWPNQDYDAWDWGESTRDKSAMRDDTTSSGESTTRVETTPSNENISTTSGKSTTPTIKESTRNSTTTTRACASDESTPSGESTPTALIESLDTKYKLCSLYGKLNRPRVCQAGDCGIEDMLRELPEWDETKALYAMVKCHESTVEKKGRGWRAMSLSYYEGAIRDALDGATQTNGGARNGNGSRKPRPRNLAI